MIICIVGPTGVGKSALALRLAKATHGEIINGDAFQIYDEMNIGTAKPSKDEMREIPHHLFSIVSINDSFSSFDYQLLARKKIAELEQKGVPIIIVGGTGMYLKSALFDFDLAPQEEKVDLSYYEKLDNHNLHLELEKLDPEEALKIHENNRKRVLRAIEIYLIRGEKKSSLIGKQEHRALYDVCFVGLELPRETLYNRIELRVEKMIESGLEEEVLTLSSKYGEDHKAFQAIGYKEFITGWHQNKKRDDIIQEIKNKSRAYARRQFTYFRNQFDVNWFSSVDEAYQFSLERLNKRQ